MVIRCVHQFIDQNVHIQVTGWVIFGIRISIFLIKEYLGQLKDPIKDNS